MTIDTTGNVWIWTTTPWAKLNIRETVVWWIADWLLTNNDISIWTEAWIFFSPSTAGWTIRGARISWYQEDGANSIWLKFYTWIGASITEKMFIWSDGNVWIWTTTPWAKLDVVPWLYKDWISIHWVADSWNVETAFRIKSDKAELDDTHTMKHYYSWDYRWWDFKIFHKDWGSTITNPIILHSRWVCKIWSSNWSDIHLWEFWGNVWIWTTSPVAPLQIENSLDKSTLFVNSLHTTTPDSAIYINNNSTVSNAIKIAWTWNRSIEIWDGTISGSTTNKLYASGWNLFWNGIQLN